MTSDQPQAKQPVCDVCGRSGHKTKECRKLKEYEKWVTEMETKSKQSSVKTKTTVPQIQKSSEFIDSDVSDEDVFNPTFTSKGYQYSTSIIDSVITNEDEDSPYLAQYDNGACIRSIEIKVRELAFDFYLGTDVCEILYLSLRIVVTLDKLRQENSELF